MDTIKKKGIMILAGFPEMDFRPIDLVAHELTITGTFLGIPRTCAKCSRSPGRMPSSQWSS